MNIVQDKKCNDFGLMLLRARWHLSGLPAAADIPGLCAPQQAANSEVSSAGLGNLVFSASQHFFGL